MEEWKKV